MAEGGGIRQAAYPAGKLSYLVEENTPEEWLDLALYSVREEEYGDFARVKENVAYKQSDAYRQNIPSGGQYRGKGYIARESVEHDARLKKVVLTEKGDPQPGDA